MSAELKIHPQRDLVLCVYVRDDMTKGGIHIPKTSNRTTRLAPFRVIAVGPGRWDQGGYQEVRVKPGDMLFAQQMFAATFTTQEEMLVNGEHFPAGTNLALVFADGIMAVVEGEESGAPIGDILTKGDMVQ